MASTDWWVEPVMVECAAGEGVEWARSGRTGF